MCRIIIPRLLVASFKTEWVSLVEWKIHGVVWSPGVEMVVQYVEEILLKMVADKLVV
jgi:hypothetical protein